MWQKVSPNGKWKQGWKWAPGPGPRVERRRDDPAPLPGHRHHPGQPAARGNTTQRPAQQDQQMLRWIHSHSLVMTLQPEVFHHSDYIASYVSCVTCQVDKYAVSRPQLQDNSWDVLQVTAIYWVLVYGGMERSSGLWLAFWEANAYMSILPLSKTGHNVIVQRIFLEDIPDWPLNSEHCQDQTRHVGKVWQCLEWRVQYLEKHGNTSRFSMRLQPIGKKL